jgi:hypothetical protein
MAKEQIATERRIEQVCRHIPAAAERAVQLDRRLKPQRTELRQAQLLSEQIALRIEHFQIV